MKRSRGIRPEHDRDEGGTAKSLRRFLFKHGEKFVTGVLVIVAIWFALQIRTYQPPLWLPDELEELAGSTEKIIANNGLPREDDDIRIFDYAAHAQKIKEMVPHEPYHDKGEWFPVLFLPPLPRGSFEILPVQSLRGEAARRAGLDTGGQTKQWQRPPIPGTAMEADGMPSGRVNTVWVNLYGTIPVAEQWDVYYQVLNTTIAMQRPEYVYYEIERTEIIPKEETVWKPIIVYALENLQAARLIPFGQQEMLQEQNSLLFSDFDVEPATTYAYRMRLYVRNPNYNLQETSVQEGVDTINEFIRSDWSTFAKVYVPDRTLVQLRSVSPMDQSDFPRQTNPLIPINGILTLDYFDVEQGLSLPLVEKREVRRGMLGNMSKEEANKSLNRGNTGEAIMMNYPDTGLRSDVCVMDLTGGRRLQKKQSRDSQASPDLFAPGKALLLMPNGTIQTISTGSELFR